MFLQLDNIIESLDKILLRDEQRVKEYGKRVDCPPKVYDEQSTTTFHRQLQPSDEYLLQTHVDRTSNPNNERT
jgi:predicted metal-binding protein